MAIASKIKRTFINFLRAPRFRLKSRFSAILKLIVILAFIQLIYYGSYRTQRYPPVKALKQTKVNDTQVKNIIKQFDTRRITNKVASSLSDDEKRAFLDQLAENQNITSGTLGLYASSNLDVLLSKQVPLKDKCDLFFYHFHSQRYPLWDLDSDLYDPEAFDKDSYIASRKEEKLRLMKKKFMSKAKNQIVAEAKRSGKKLTEEEVKASLPQFEDKVPEEALSEFEKMHAEALEQNIKIETDKLNRVSNLRIFGKCFFNEAYENKEPESEEGASASKVSGSLSSEICPFTEKKLLPFLSFKYPVYQRWNGNRYYTIPLISNILKNDQAKAGSKKVKEYLPETVDPSSLGNKKCFISSFYNSINGKGIVLSVSDTYIVEVAKLIKVLRLLGNKYPIQIVHRNDLSKKNQKFLVKHAREEFKKLSPDLRDIVEDFASYNFEGYIDHQFPKQELWFVNIRNAIENNYTDLFDGYSNKLLAYLFNSFDEIMLMDTDTIPLLPTEKLFALDKYVEHGALFFRDRDLDDLLWKYDANLWKKVMPKKFEQTFFEIPESTDLTLKNRYLGDERRHFMEAGLVLVKRSAYFTGVLMSLEINLWGAVSSDKVWGDKEFFWLGQLIAGNENYRFNENQAGAAGEVHHVSGKVSSEVCSAHPGHVWDKDNKTLLWINSGFQNCKKDTWNNDVYNERFKRTRFNNKKILKLLYKDFTRINAIIVPPVTDYVVKNSANEPIFGWYKTNLCDGFIWCAYDIIGASELPSDRGTLVEFDERTQKFYLVVGAIWNR